MQSMTGFGRAQSVTTNYQVEVEISSVNRKQVDVAVSLPKPFASLETAVRKFVSERISRGRLNVSIKLAANDAAAQTSQINEAKATQIYEQLMSISQKMPALGTPQWQDVLGFSEVIESAQVSVDAEEAFTEILPTLDQAFQHLQKMRHDEGDNLKVDLTSRLMSLRQLRERISEVSSKTVGHYREVLLERLRALDLALDVNDERVVKEVAIFADRCDISEEVTRLDSHFNLFEQSLQKNEPVGRPLDFLCQEINREFNTISSKANDAALAQLSVQGKTELEKIREQVQNIE